MPVAKFQLIGSFEDLKLQNKPTFKFSNPSDLSPMKAQDTPLEPAETVSAKKLSDLSK